MSFENVPDSFVTRFQIENFWDSAWINSCSNSNALRKQTQSLPKSLLGKSNYVDHSRTFEVDPNGPQLSSRKTGCIQSTVTWNINIQGFFSSMNLKEGPLWTQPPLPFECSPASRRLGLSYQFWLARCGKLPSVLKRKSLLSLKPHFPLSFESRTKPCGPRLTVGSHQNSQKVTGIGLGQVLQRHYKNIRHWWRMAYPGLAVSTVLKGYSQWV